MKEWEQGKYEDALKNYHRLLEVSKNLGDKKMSSQTLFDIGRLYEELGNKEEAVRYYKMSMDSSKEEEWFYRLAKKRLIKLGR